jgi:hypothetical protein
MAIVGQQIGVCHRAEMDRKEGTQGKSQEKGEKMTESENEKLINAKCANKPVHECSPFFGKKSDEKWKCGDCREGVEIEKLARVEHLNLNGHLKLTLAAYQPVDVPTCRRVQWSHHSRR